MADKKISALTAATTPLAGTEVLPIVQSGSTVKVSISDVTAGRSVSASALNVSGDISFGAALTSGTGVSTGDCKIELGGNRSGSGATYIDLHSASGTDYEGRILRNSGTNGSFDIVNAGSGALTLGTNNLVRTRIDGNGNVSVGTGSLSTTATDGFPYIPTCAGTPTGTPTAISGFAPMVVDSTNNKLYVYIGGAWRVMN